MANKKSERWVVVTTSHRGVFYGQLSDDKAPASLVLKNARMCISWASSIRGVLGLASNGPDKNCRIGHAIPGITLYNITSVMDCSDEAKAAWEKAPWV